MSLVATGRIDAKRSLSRSIAQQNRSYFFVPLTWVEFRERFERWIKPTDPRVVSVQVFSRKILQQENQKYERISKTPILRDKGKWGNWFKNRNKKMGYYTPALPLPNPKGTRMERLAERYQGWKSRRKDDYAGWKARRRQDYEGWKTNRKERFENWKSRRLLKTKEIVVKEYCQPDWFDDLGRPLTSRDSTGRFVNPWQSQTTNGVHSLGTLLTWRYIRLRRLFKQYVWQYENGMGNTVNAMPQLRPQQPMPPLPPLDRNDTSKVQLTWIGHATCYVQLHGVTILTDPIFSHRAGPAQWAPFGPCREVAASHSYDELMTHTGARGIDICCITHDHYDHLDYDSIQKLKGNVETWIVPLGIKEWLIVNGDISPDSIVEMEWWDQIHLDFRDSPVRVLDGPKEVDDSNGKPMTITCCPASHWGSRNMSDRNTRLWCSFAFESNDQRVFLSGDSGYPTFPLFRQIADTLGPFDLSTIPIGAYEPAVMNKDSHANPYEAVRIHKDLRSHRSVAIHWGTFPLSEEELYEPPMQLKLALEKEKVDENDFIAIRHGSSVQV
ncbi:unnamed protein product [Cylindrotheca closterium]|uniref:Metallo-beta-lactamase domain-containing protein n=1 Tax=Cylindrotheca closterium TaxID=2856 RepID=A0AAD2JJ80_9STRA|nr:unnamed protein product [Cylindrotheca closterium]